MLASAAADTLCVWDFEHGTSLGSYTDLPADITAMAFLHPHPALLTADAKGGLSLWACRPNPFNCVLRFANESRGDDDGDDSNKIGKDALGSAVLSLSWDEASRVLVSGDEAGHMRVWDLTSTLESLHLDQCVEYTTKKGLGGGAAEKKKYEHRKMREDEEGGSTNEEPQATVAKAEKEAEAGAETAAEAEADIEAGIDAENLTPAKVENSAEARLSKISIQTSSSTTDVAPPVCVRTIRKAHSDSVLRVSILQTENLAQPTVVSTGHDCLVHFHTIHDGVRVGALYQGSGSGQDR